MMRRPSMIAAFAALGAGLLLADPAPGQTAAENAAAWGLLGTWAVDCRSPPSASNAYLSYAVKGTGLVHRRDLGDMHDEHAITAAGILPDGSLEIVVNLATFGQVRTIVLQKQGKGMIRAVTNRDANGNYSIRSGLLPDGRPSAIQFRCSTPTG